jgi:uncharacterized protein (DUF488 family)
MQTSYFAKSANHEKAVSIAGKAPDWYIGRSYKMLAPKIWFFKKYKEDGDEKFYIEQYQKEVLDKLDARKVYDELGEDAVLLCWEKSGKFCHRILVAKWFKSKLNVDVLEI